MIQGTSSQLTQNMDFTKKCVICKCRVQICSDVMETLTIFHMKPAMEVPLELSSRRGAEERETLIENNSF